MSVRPLIDGLVDSSKEVNERINILQDPKENSKGAVEPVERVTRHLKEKMYTEVVTTKIEENKEVLLLLYSHAAAECYCIVGNFHKGKL